MIKKRNDHKFRLTDDQYRITYTNDRINGIGLIYRSLCELPLFSNLKTHCTISNKWCPSSRMHTTWRLVYIDAHVRPFSLSFFRTSNIISSKIFSRRNEASQQSRINFALQTNAEHVVKLKESFEHIERPSMTRSIKKKFWNEIWKCM